MMRVNVLLSLLLPFTVFADGVTSCKEVHYRENVTYSINARLHHATHIILPEQLVADPIAGNKELWITEGRANHIFIKPTTQDDKEGVSTTVTAVTRSNKSFHFFVKRSKDAFDLCVVVKLDGALIVGNALSNIATPDRRQLEGLQQQTAALQQQLQQSDNQATRKVEDALSTYRSYIYTRYQWSGGKKPYGKNLVSDVYDDGRYTFIRLVHDVQGAYAVFANQNGNEQFIDYSYDEENKLYRLTGIFDSLFLKQDEHTRITIHRVDDSSHGNY
jgi:type IV secretory pathway VirB9-like protein